MGGKTNMSNMSEFIFEIYCEEIPARMQKAARESIEQLFTKFFEEKSLSFEGLKCYSTPRRLTLHIAELQDNIPAFTEEVRGPRTNAPEKALEGFLKSQNASQKDLTQKETDKGEFYFLEKKFSEQNTIELLQSFVPEAIKSINWPKSMTWGQNTFRFVRPILNIMCLFGGQLVQGKLDLGHDQLAFTDFSFGHPFMNSDKIKVQSFKKFKDDLELAFVVLDQDQRREIIFNRIKVLLKKLPWHINDDPQLIEELVHLTEWPNPILATITPNFMALPEEVLDCAMKHHQKYISIYDDKGEIVPRCIVVTNFIPSSNKEIVLHGHEKVLAARLNDAHFFYNHDLSIPLDSFHDKLKEITYHAELGTMLEKAERLEKVALILNATLPKLDEKTLKRAACLAKADLASGMVGEFPELQGVMGSYYAQSAGENEEISLALKEHYRPSGADDLCPQSNISNYVALADKIDHLLAFFSIGLRPTGSKDPFALRRSALGILRILLENDYSLSFSKICEQVISLYKHEIQEKDSLLSNVLSFMRQRLDVILKDKGYSPDVIAAIPHHIENDDYFEIFQHVSILQKFVTSQEGEHLLTAYRRANNIVSIEKKNNPDLLSGTIQSDLMQLKEEQELYDAYQFMCNELEPVKEKNDFENAITILSGLRPALDAFFDKVMVNDENLDLRKNRLCLLNQIRDEINQMADFSKIVR